MSDMFAEESRFIHKEPEREYWEWLNIRQTAWKRGSIRLYIAVLRSWRGEPDSPSPRQAKVIKVLFWAKKPRRLLKQACREPRTRSELKRFFEQYQ